MTALDFEDVHTFAGNQDVYATTNESVHRWDELLGDLPPIYSAGGICSGGEVAFFNLLPRVRRKLVLVDHSYTNMYFAVVKYLALQKYGPEVYERFVSCDNPVGRVAMNAMEEELQADVPAPLSEARRASLREHTHLLQRFWASQQKTPLTKTCAKLGRVKFVHGDLTDLAQFGKYDLLYLSNALEQNHLTRDRARSNAENIAECVKPGGYIALSHSSYNRPSASTRWELVKEIKPTNRGVNELGWDYRLYQVAA